MSPENRQYHLLAIFGAFTFGFFAFAHFISETANRDNDVLEMLETHALLLAIIVAILVPLCIYLAVETIRFFIFKRKIFWLDAFYEMKGKVVQLEHDLGTANSTAETACRERDAMSTELQTEKESIAAERATHFNLSCENYRYRDVELMYEEQREKHETARKALEATRAEVKRLQKKAQDPDKFVVMTKIKMGSLQAESDGKDRQIERLNEKIKSDRLAFKANHEKYNQVNKVKESLELQINANTDAYNKSLRKTRMEKEEMMSKLQKHGLRHPSIDKHLEICGMPAPVEIPLGVEAYMEEGKRLQVLVTAMYAEGSRLKQRVFDLENQLAATQTADPKQTQEVAQEDYPMTNTTPKQEQTGAQTPLPKEIKALRDQNERLQKSLASLQTIQTREHNTLRKENEELKKSLTNAQNGAPEELKTLYDQNEQLNKSLAGAKTAQNDINQSREESKQLKKALADAQTTHAKEVHDLQAENTQLKQTLADKETSQAKALKGAEEEHNRLQKTVADVQGAQTTHAAELKSTQNENAQLKQALDECQSQSNDINNFQIENGQLKQALAECRAAQSNGLNAARTESQELRKALLEAQSAQESIMQGAQNEIVQIKQAAEDQVLNARQTATNEVSQFHGMINNALQAESLSQQAIQSENIQLKQTIASMEATHAKSVQCLQEENAKFKRNLEGAKSKDAEEAEKYKKWYLSMQDTAFNLEITHARKEEECSKEISKLKKALATASKQSNGDVAPLQQEITALKKLAQTVEEHHKSVVKQLTDDKTQHEQMISVANKVIQQLKKEVKDYQNATSQCGASNHIECQRQIKEQDLIIEGLNMDIQARDTNTAKPANHKECEAKLAALNKDFAKVKEELKFSDIGRNFNQTSLSRVGLEKLALTQEVETLKQQLGVTEAALKQLQEAAKTDPTMELDSLRTQVRDSEARCKRLTTEASVLRKELKASKAEVTDLLDLSTATEALSSVDINAAADTLLAAADPATKLANPPRRHFSFDVPNLPKAASMLNTPPSQVKTSPYQLTTKPGQAKSPSCFITPSSSRRSSSSKSAVAKNPDAMDTDVPASAPSPSSITPRREAAINAKKLHEAAVANADLKAKVVSLQQELEKATARVKSGKPTIVDEGAECGHTCRRHCRCGSRYSEDYVWKVESYIALELARGDAEEMAVYEMKEEGTWEDSDPEVRAAAKRAAGPKKVKK